MGVKIVTQLDHDQWPSLRLLASTIRAFAFFIDVAGPVPNVGEKFGQISVRDSSLARVYDGERPIGGIVGRL